MSDNVGSLCPGTTVVEVEYISAGFGTKVGRDAVRDKCSAVVAVGLSCHVAYISLIRKVSASCILDASG